MKRVLFLSAFTNPYSYNNNRVMGVAGIFQAKGWNVEIITTSFSHTYKKQYSEFIRDQKPLFSTHFIPVPSYKSNISIIRLFSHFVFALKTYFYLKRLINKYDLIYCTVPTNLAPYLVNRLAKENKVPNVIDIIDIWPESFYLLAGKLQCIFKVLSYPWLLISHSLYRSAVILVSASKKYAEFGQQFHKYKVNEYLLGVDKGFTKKLVAESLASLPFKMENEVWIAYGGSLGNSYDFDIILGALVELELQKIKYRFFFIGGGVLEDRIKNRIKEKELNATITGRLDYADYLKWLDNCDIAINSYKKGSLVGYSYKFSDYLATGCCILNNLPGETAELVEKYKLGINFGHNKNELASALRRLIEDQNLLSFYKSNVKKAVTNEFSKAVIMEKLYTSITNRLGFK